MKSSTIVRWVLILAVVFGLGYLVYGKIIRTEKKAVANAAAGGGGKPGGGQRDMMVEGYVVRSERLSNTIEANGTLLSNEETNIQAELSARVVRLFFREGQIVSKGALLAKLYDADLKAQLQKIESQKQLAERTLERNKTLLAKGGVAQQQVDVDAATVEGFNADIANVQAQLQRTEIRAPFNGVIGLRYISEGTVVSPSTIIASLQQNNPLKLDFSVPEKYSDVVHINDLVKFTVASGQTTYRGKVYAIEPKVDPTTRTIHLRAIVDNPRGELHPGQFAKIILELSTTPEALMVPSQAVVPTARDKQLIIARNGKANFVTVETGVRSANKVQIMNGITAGDTIVTSGVLQLKPDASLKIVRVTK